MKVQSIHELGGSGTEVTIESSFSQGLPALIVVGSAGKSLDEAKERVRSSFSASAIPFPKKRITINLYPSELQKDGSHYDLAIALAIMLEAKLITLPNSDNIIIIGELGLDGTIRPVRGVIGKLLASISCGYTRFIIPSENAQQANLIEGISYYAARSLKEIYQVFSSPNVPFQESKPYKADTITSKPTGLIDINEVVGQARAKRALEIAVSGGHNVLLNGPPGVGKSMLAKAARSIMTDPSHDEIVSITHIHSLQGDVVTDLVRSRPFRSPHHSSSDISIIGGGQNPRPGEVSLAHNGILFLDELPEFKRSTIESLRQPLEDSVVTVARAKHTVTYPANFMLIATQNPCPCGFYGSDKPCTCTPIEIHRYRKKLSGPILDRIDIHVTVDNVDHQRLLQHSTTGESSQHVKKRVSKAQVVQRARQNKLLNGKLGNKDIKKHSNMTPEAKELLDTAADKMGISARVYMKLVKVARTIADIEQSDFVEKHHVAEALQYRPLKQD